MSDTTPEEPIGAPQVTTRSPWHISRIPGHLGRARTSTVVLAVLFVAIFALYLYVKPETPATATGGTGVPASTTAPARPTTAAPTTTPEQTSEQQPTTATEAPTTTAAPTDTTTSTLPSDSSVPTTTPSLPTPTVSSPAG